MATIYFLGEADAVAQVSTIQVTAFDAATTYTVTIGGVAVSVAGVTDANATAAALQVALDASTHPYFAAITWTVSTDTITATAAVAGVPFVAASSVASGTGTIGAVTEVTASAGPNDWSTAANWSTGAVPVNSDDVIIEGHAVNIAWGLDQASVTLDSLDIRKTYTGRIGLDQRIFTTDPAAETASTLPKVDYHDHYLAIGYTLAHIGQHIGPSSPNGSDRIKLDNRKSGASTTVVHDTASQAAETGFAAVRLLAAHASADLVVRGATAGVGVAMDEPGETSTLGAVSCRLGSLYLREGVTWTSLAVTGGQAVVQAANTPTSLDIDGGSVSTEGDYTITTVNANGGTLFANHVKTSGVAITTLNLNGGVVDARGNQQARTFTTVNPNEGTLIVDDDVVTITTLNQPTGERQITIQ